MRYSGYKMDRVCGHCRRRRMPSRDTGIDAVAMSHGRARMRYDAPGTTAAIVDTGADA